MESGTALPAEIDRGCLVLAVLCQEAWNLPSHPITDPHGTTTSVWLVWVFFMNGTETAFLLEILLKPVVSTESTPISRGATPGKKHRHTLQHESQFCNLPPCSKSVAMWAQHTLTAGGKAEHPTNPKSLTKANKAWRNSDVGLATLSKF